MNATKWETVGNCAYLSQDSGDMDYAKLHEMVEKRDSAYAVVKRGVEKDVADQVRAFVKDNKLDSIYLYTDSTRYYPYGNFLSHGGRL